jgi:hypothetical protein
VTDSDLNDFYIGENPLISKEIAKFEDKKYPQTPYINSALGKTKMQCKLLKISRTVRGFPSYHFQINGKIFFYGFQGIKKDDKILLICTKPYQKEQLNYTCGCQSYILPLKDLNEIIAKSPLKRERRFMDRRKTGKMTYAKTMDRTNPRVYDVNNYNINSFEIGKGHRCLGTEFDAYIKKYEL